MEQQDVKLTPEMQERLKGYMAFGPNPEFLYVPEVYREKDEHGNYIIPKGAWPVFKLRGKTGLEIADEEDNAGYVDPSTSRLHLTTGRKRIEVLRKNILGWKNFRDENDNEIVCGKIVNGEVYKILDSLKFFPAALQRELHEAINEQSKLNEEELRGLEF